MSDIEVIPPEDRGADYKAFNSPHDVDDPDILQTLKNNGYDAFEISGSVDNLAGSPPLCGQQDEDMPYGLADAEDDLVEPEEGWDTIDSYHLAAIQEQAENGQRAPKAGSATPEGGLYKEDHDEWNLSEQRMLRHYLLESGIAFMRYFMKKQEGIKFITNRHHRVLQRTLDKVLDGEIKRLIINIPPGYTKTEAAVKHFIARGLAKNPRSKFIHISYADSLALLNSSGAKEICTSEDYQMLFPMTLKMDAKSKSMWYTNYGGGMLAVSSGGIITGFRAGRMMEGFSGAMIIDDPIKPDDAYSEVIRTRVNQRFTNTFKSRLAHEGVPIIVIMQRIHEEDPTGYLLKGGTGDKWHHLVLPVDIPEDPEAYPKEYTHGIPIDHNLEPGPLWPYKHTAEDIELLKTDPYTYAAQYDQRPAPLGGGMFKDEWWQYYDVDPNVEYKIITVDVANKTKEHNDYSVMQCWGYRDGNIYLLDQVRGKWEAPDLRTTFIAFWLKHHGTGVQTRGQLTATYVEDKANGTALIQDIGRMNNPVIPIFPIQRSTDKVTRAMGGIPYIASKRVYLPRKSDFLSDYLDEHRKFTPLMTHKNDDQIDPTLDAIDMLLRPPVNEAGTW